MVYVVCTLVRAVEMLSSAVVSACFYFSTSCGVEADFLVLQTYSVTSDCANMWSTFRHPIARSMWSDHLTKFKRFWTWHWAFLFRRKHLYCKWDIITRWCLRCSCRSSSHKRQNEYRAIEETTPYHLNFFSGSFLDLVVWCVYCAYAAANTFATNPVFRRVLWRDVLCIVTPRKIIRLHKETLDAFLTTVETGSLPSKSGDCYLTNLNSVHRVPFHKVWRVALQFNTCLNS